MEFLNNPLQQYILFEDSSLLGWDTVFWVSSFQQRIIVLSSSRPRSSHSIKKDHFTLKMNRPQSFEISRSTHPLTQYHFSEDFSNIAVKTSKVTFSLLYDMAIPRDTQTTTTTSTINGMRIPHEKTNVSTNSKLLQDFCEM
jgi:hypothetical protein